MNKWASLWLIGGVLLGGFHSAPASDLHDALRTADSAREGVTQKQQTFPEVTINDTESRPLGSEYIKENYEIDIYLPKDYRKENARYPVVFVLDAEYNFGRVAYIAGRLIKNGDIPKVIVVGIACQSDDEDYFYKAGNRDCTPPSRIHGYHTGGVENFISFFKKELIPFVKANYRILPDRPTIAGHSIGGFFCGYCLFKHPEIFKNFAIVSPSFWFSDEVMFNYGHDYAQGHTELEASVFLATGGDESP